MIRWLPAIPASLLACWAASLIAVDSPSQSQVRNQESQVGINTTSSAPEAIRVGSTGMFDPMSKLYESSDGSIREEDRNPTAIPEIRDSSPRVAGEAKAVTRSPRVLFIVSKNCEQCHRDLIRLKRLGGDFDSMKARGWIIGESEDCHLQIVDRDAIPRFIQEVEIREFPAVVCVDDDQILRSFKHGCTTPLDKWTFGFLLTGNDERPPGHVPEPAKVASTGNYRLRGNHWSVDGDWNPTLSTLVNHLRSPVHAYQIAAAWRIESWSVEELRSLHDDLHEREQRGTASAFTGQSRSSLSSSSRNEFSASRKIIGGR